MKQANNNLASLFKTKPEPFQIVATPTSHCYKVTIDEGFPNSNVSTNQQNLVNLILHQLLCRMIGSSDGFTSASSSNSEYHCTSILHVFQLCCLFLCLWDKLCCTFLNEFFFDDMRNSLINFGTAGITGGFSH